MAPLRYWAKRSAEEDSKQRGQGESAVRTRVRRVAKVVENALSLSYRKEHQRQRQRLQTEEEEEEEEEAEDQQHQDKEQGRDQQAQQQEQQQTLEHDADVNEEEEKDTAAPVDRTIDLRRSRTISAKEMNAVLQHREVIMERRLSLPEEHPRSISTEDGHTDHEDSDSGEQKQKARPDSIE